MYIQIDLLSSCIDRTCRCVDWSLDVLWLEISWLRLGVAGLSSLGFNDWGNSHPRLSWTGSASSMNQQFLLYPSVSAVVSYRSKAPVQTRTSSLSSMPALAGQSEFTAGLKAMEQGLFHTRGSSKTGQTVWTDGDTGNWFPKCNSAYEWDCTLIRKWLFMLLLARPSHLKSNF